VLSLKELMSSYRGRDMAIRVGHGNGVAQCVVGHGGELVEAVAAGVARDRGRVSVRVIDIR
jgi:hypothetical protein